MRCHPPPQKKKTERNRKGQKDLTAVLELSRNHPCTQFALCVLCRLDDSQSERGGEERGGAEGRREREIKGREGERERERKRERDEREREREKERGRERKSKGSEGTKQKQSRGAERLPTTVCNRILHLRCLKI